MAEQVKCRWPSCEDETDCMSGCKPAPPMTAPSIKEAFVGVLASLAAAISILERTPRAKKSVASDKMFSISLNDYRKALDEGRAALATLPPDPTTSKKEVVENERREAIARVARSVLMDDPESDDPGLWLNPMDAEGIDDLCEQVADAILASGLVQDEAGIRADEPTPDAPDDPREAFAYFVSKCAEGLGKELMESGQTETQARNQIIHHLLDFAAGEACRVAMEEHRSPDREKWTEAVDGAFARAFKRTAAIRSARNGGDET